LHCAGEGNRFERTHLDSGQRIELLKNTPKGFREQAMPMPARAEEPHPVANGLRDARAGKNAVARTGGTPIIFNARSRTFAISREAMEGHRSATVLTPINNRNGNLLPLFRQVHGVGPIAPGPLWKGTFSQERRERQKTHVFRPFSLQKRGCLFTFSLSGYLFQDLHKESFTSDFMGSKNTIFRGMGGGEDFWGLLPGPSALSEIPCPTICRTFPTPL